MDYTLFQIVNGWAGRWPIFDLLVRLLVNDYFVPSALALTLLFLWYGGRSQQERHSWQRAVCYSALALLLANGAVKGLNAVVFRRRPFFDHNVHLLFYRPSDSSWPSNPAAVTFAMAMAVWLHDRRVGAFMIALALCMSLARVVAGVHYPGDLLSGALIGVGAAYAVCRYDHGVRSYIDRFIDLARKIGLA